MTQPPPRPFPEAVLLAPGEEPSSGSEAWLYEGVLERFAGAGPDRFAYRQRVAWPAGTPWESIRDFGLWTVDRLSINGHLLVGLRARREPDPPEQARRVAPPE